MKTKTTIPTPLLDEKTLYIDGFKPELFFPENSFFLVRKEIINSNFQTIIKANEVIKIIKTDFKVIREDCRCLGLEWKDYSGYCKETDIYVDGGYYSFGAFIKTHFIPIDKMFKEWCS